MQVRKGRVWVALAAFAALSCGGRQLPEDRGESAFEEAENVHRRAEQDNRRTREALFDQARDKYQEACSKGHQEACRVHAQLDAALKDRRGECSTAAECFEQGRSWLPSTRGEHRLRRLCLGEQVQVSAATSPPAWDAHGPSCAALGDFYLDARRLRHAAFIYRKGCEAASHAPSCRGEATRVLGDGASLDPKSVDPRRGELLRLAAPHLERGCELGGAASCALLARVALARHQVRFPDVHSLRYSLVDADPKELLQQAHTAAARGCELGEQPACESVAQADAALKHVTGLLESGCAFLKNCGRGEICNAETGRCEGRGSKGGFYGAYESGISRFDARDFAGAAKQFKKARRMAPHLPGPWRWLGLIALREQRYWDCVKSTEEALRLNPRSKHAEAMRAIIEHCRQLAGR